MSNLLNVLKVSAGACLLQPTRMFAQTFVQAYGIPRGLAMSGALTGIGFLHLGSTIRKCFVLSSQQYGWGQFTSDALFWSATTTFGVSCALDLNHQFRNYVLVNQQRDRVCESAVNKCAGLDDLLCAPAASAARSVFKSTAIYNTTMRLP